MTYRNTTSAPAAAVPCGEKGVQFVRHICKPNAQHNSQSKPLGHTPNAIQGGTRSQMFPYRWLLSRQQQLTGRLCHLQIGVCCAGHQVRLTLDRHAVDTLKVNSPVVLLLLLLSLQQEHNLHQRKLACTYTSPAHDVLIALPTSDALIGCRNCICLTGNVPPPVNAHKA